MSLGLSVAVKEWTAQVQSLLDDDGPLDYSEVRSLNDEGWALIGKLRARARHLRKLARNRGKYAPWLESEAQELATLADEMEDMISELWDEFKARRWER